MIEEVFREELLSKVKLLKDEKKRKVIETIIKKDKWYMDVDIEMFISILCDLGIDKNSSIEIYKKLHIV